MPEPVSPESLQSLLKEVHHHFQRALRASGRAQAYLQERSISADTVARYGLGYAREAPRDLGHVLSRHPHPTVLASRLLVEGGAADERPRDRFRDRLMFPIRTTQGDVVGFAGRALGAGSATWKRSVESRFFPSARLWYGLHEAQADIRWKRSAYVVKGCFDTLAMIEAGYTQTVGTIDGTVHSAQLATLVPMCDQITFCLDGREQARQTFASALLAAAPFLRTHCAFHFVQLDDGHDPESVLKSLGRTVLAVALRHAQPFFRALEDQIRSGCDLDDPQERARCCDRAGAYWSVLPAGRERDALLAWCCDLLQLESDEVARAWTQVHGPVPVADRPHED